MAIPSSYRPVKLVLPSIHGIATPVCGLVRNDVVFFTRSTNYSLLRMILPEMVLGSSSRNSTILGYL